MSKRLAIAVSSIGVVLLASCSSTSDDAAKSSTTSSTSTTTSSSTSTQAPSSTSDTESSSASSSAASSSATSSATETSSSSSSGSVAPGKGALIDDAGLKAITVKMGCTAPSVQVPKGEAAAKGSVGAIQCTTKGNLILAFRTKTADQVPVVMTALRNKIKEGTFPYVKGSNWALIVSGQNGNKEPTKADTEAAQKIIGGEVENA